MLPELGKLLDQAFHQARPLASILADAILAGATPRIIDTLSRAFLEGKRIAWATHGTYLRAPRNLPARVVRAWRGEALERAGRIHTRIRETLDNRGHFTKLELRSYATVTTEQAIWQGQDTGGTDIANLAAAEWKEWVRAWPRKDHRDHHDIMEGNPIPIEKLFILPGGRNAGSRVYGPRDWDRVGDAGEWLHCGHALRFHQAVTREMTRGSLQGAGTIYDPTT